MDQEIDGPDGLEIMSEIISLACISIMALLFGSKSKIERFNTLTYGRTLVILLYILSWTFSAIAIVSVSTNNCKSETTRGSQDNYSCKTIVAREQGILRTRCHDLRCVLCWQ